MKVLPLEISVYLTERCKVLGWKRSELTRRLGYANVSRALRNYDAFCEGSLEQHDLLHRLMQCKELAGEEFDVAMRLSRERIERDTKEAALAAKLRQEQEIEEARIHHIPHLWIEHERSRPSPIFVLAFCGLKTFKVLDLPDVILDITNHERRLEAVQEFVKEASERLHGKIPLRGPFGYAISALFRDTYDHSFVISLHGEVIGERHKAPPMPMVTLRLK